jgi:hypothetical protein
VLYHTLHGSNVMIGVPRLVAAVGQAFIQVRVLHAYRALALYAASRLVAAVALCFHPKQSDWCDWGASECARACQAAMYAVEWGRQ